MTAIGWVITLGLAGNLALAWWLLTPRDDDDDRSQR